MVDKNIHFTRLKDFFSFLDRELPHKKCRRCGRCCHIDLDMTKLEYDYICDYIAENDMVFELEFVALSPDKDDARLSCQPQRCVFYDQHKGCLIYPVRPFACRIFGIFIQEEMTGLGCEIEDPIIYKSPRELPFWERYIDITKRYSFQVGYITGQHLNSTDYPKNTFHPS